MNNIARNNVNLPQKHQNHQNFNVSSSNSLSMYTFNSNQNK